MTNHLHSSIHSNKLFIILTTNEIGKCIDRLQKGVMFNLSNTEPSTSRFLKGVNRFDIY